MAPPVFAVSFRINDSTADEKRDYEERRAAIVVAVKSFADGVIWDETTSFLLFDGLAGTNIADIVKKVEAEKHFRKDKEKLLVVRLDKPGYAAAGVNGKANALKRILGKLKPS